MEETKIVPVVDPASLLNAADAGRTIGTGPSTIYRWAERGLFIGGELLRLRVKWIGPRLYTTEAWLQEFQDKIIELRSAHANRTAERLREQRAAESSGRPRGRPRRIDPNVRQQQIDAAIEKIRNLR